MCVCPALHAVVYENEVPAKHREALHKLYSAVLISIMS